MAAREARLDARPEGLAGDEGKNSEKKKEKELGVFSGLGLAPLGTEATTAFIVRNRCEAMGRGTLPWHSNSKHGLSPTESPGGNGPC